MSESIRKNVYGVFLLFLAIMVAACGGENQKQTAEKKTKPRATITQADSAKAPKAKLNINTASEEAFRKIPNVGDKMVHEFEEYRPYVSIRQFRKEIGKYVSEEQVAAYEKYIYVPIHRNDSDVATLMQIPGLENSEAQKLSDGRPYDTNKAFLDALSSYVDKDQLAIAKSYLKSE